jgi:hypothetical protein
MWAGGWGGTSDDECHRIAMDSFGDVCVVGNYYELADFDPGPGSDYHASAGLDDAFVSKFDPDGNLQWAKTFGSEESDSCWSVCFDGTDVYITGGFYNTVDFDPGSGVWHLTSEGLADVYVSKFDSAGNLIWAVSWGGPGADTGRGIDVDTSGNIYISGTFELTADMDPGEGTDSFTSAGLLDIFVVKLNSEGVHQWARAFGETDDDYVRDNYVDHMGSVLTIGRFYNTMDMDPGTEVDNHTSLGNSDGYALKLLPNGYWE